MDLPQASTGQAEQSAQVTVTIDRQGRIALNRRAIAFDALEGAVRQLQQPNQELVVVLNADTGLYHGQVVQVMDRLRRVPGVKLAIATQAP